MNATEEPRPPLPQRIRIGAAVVLCLVPLLLLALPLPPTSGKWAVQKTNWVLGAAIVTAVAAGAALVRNRRDTLALILLGTSILVMANWGWNTAFRQYYSNHSYKREVFRKAMRNFYAPLYGKYDNALARRDPRTGRYSLATLPFAIGSLVIAAVWYGWARQRPLDRRWGTRSFAVLFSLQLLLIIFFALCEPWPKRLSLNISGYLEFKKDLPAFNGISDLLRNYVAKMPSLQWYGQHYPPGNLLLLAIERDLGIPGLTKSIVCLLTIFSALPLYGLARELSLDSIAASAAILLFAASTGVLVYCTINTTSLVLFPATTCLWMLLRGLRSGSVPAGMLLGLSFAVYLFFSFSASIVGILMAITTALALWRGRVTLTNVFRTGVSSLACLFAVIALLYMTTRFNLIACFITAVTGHQAQQGNEGFDDPARYLLRSTGNILAYLISVAPLAVLGVSAAWVGWRNKAPQVGGVGALSLATLLTVLIAGFSGLFYVETERIWIFLTPCLALAAGAELSRRSAAEGQRVIYLVFLLILLISCSQEILFMHYR